MKKLFTLITIFLFTLKSQGQFATIYENSFRNWQPGQGWVFLNNDTITAGPGLVTTSYNGETYDYMLGTSVLQGLQDKIMFSPPVVLNGNAWLTIYSKSNAAATLTAFIATDENDTTLSGLTNNLGLCSQNGFKAFDISAYTNDTVRIAFRIQGTNAGGIIDNIHVFDKQSLAWIPDSCFRNYMKSMLPNAFIGDSLNFTHSHALNRTQIVYPNNCIQSLEGLQYFPFLDYINLHDGQINYIPTNTMYYLDSMDLSNNLISSLPDVPVCTVLKLDNNLLLRIPDINNQQVAFFHARNNLIYDCLPSSNRFVNGDFYNNVHVYMGSAWYYTNPNYGGNGTPIPNCSQANGHINGQVFYDVNQDNIYNAGDFLLTGQRIGFLQGPDHYTNSNGFYTVTTDTGFVDLNPISLPSWFSCVNPLNDTLGVQETIQHDFRVIATSTADDISVHVTSSGPVRLRENLVININARNYGTGVSTTSVKMYLSPGYTLVSLVNGTISNDTLIWTPTIDPFNWANNRLVIRIDSFPINVQHTFLATADLANDIMPLNNSDSVMVWIWDSLVTVPPRPVGFPFDPNNKLVSTPVVAPGFFDYLTYNINFENIGTANATHVVVKDMLPVELDYNTFEFIASSHPCTISLGTDSLIYFTFYPIALTPKSVDSLNCDGNIWFRIKPKAPIQLFDTITNVASIFFDTQPAVVTQNCDVWADSTFTLSAGNKYYEKHLLYPNPTTGLININNTDPENAISSIMVINPLGQVLKVIDNIQSRTQTLQFDINELPNGIYFVQINRSHGSGSYRVLKY